MKLQVDSGIVEVIPIRGGDICLTVGEGGHTGSVELTAREARVLVAILEATADDTLG